MRPRRHGPAPALLCGPSTSPLEDRGSSFVCLLPIGYARETGRVVFIAETDRIDGLPERISIPSSRFVLLLSYGRRDTPAHLAKTLGKLLDAGCVYLCAWGACCEYVHDIMDDVVLERELKGGPEQTIMTSWHADVPMEEAVDFALRHAQPAGALAQGCDAIVLAAVGNSEWAQELRELTPPLLRSVL